MPLRTARIYHLLTSARYPFFFATVFALSACQTASRPADGTVSALSTTIAEIETQVAAQITLITHLATRGPGRFTQPVGTVEATPYQPVHGFVEIEEGECCVGGKAGDSLDITTSFQASSPKGEVTQMRVRFGSKPFSEEELTEAEWESFVLQKAFPIEIAINWVGYYVSVQYMDENGNQSAVYHDDISVEGHP